MQFTYRDSSSDFAALADFKDDAAWEENPDAHRPRAFEGLIEGVQVIPLTPRSDDRGTLVELMTDRHGAIDPIVHVYQVFAKPGSIRAWNYHKHQIDRQAFADGDMKVVAMDFRPKSPTYRRINEFYFGSAFPCLLLLPRFVVHGVQNRGSTTATFISMPTRTYNPEQPDKSRLPYGHPGVPYSFD